MAQARGDDDLRTRGYTAGAKAAATKRHIMPNNVLSHFADRLREAEVSLDPYPHYCLENVFPDDYYQELLRNLPASDSYNNLYEVTTLKLDHFRHRDQRDMHRGWTAHLPPEQKRFWDAF